MKTWKKFSILAALVLLMFTWRPAWAVLVNALEDFVQISAPSNPPAGNSRVYVDSGTKKLACLNSDGTSCAPSSSGGSNPFTPPIPANFTTLGTGCTVATVTGPFGGSAVTILGTSGSANICGKYIAASGNFVHVFAFYSNISVNDFNQAEVGFTDGTKVESCGVQHDGGNGFVFSGLQSTALSGGSYTAAPGIVEMWGLLPQPGWFRLTSSGGGTVLKCEWSPDGNIYNTLFNDAVPYLTPSAVYIGADPRGSAVASQLTFVSYN